MKTRLIPSVIFFIAGFSVDAQDFDFGRISMTELSMKTYEPDTSAGAVVLKEFGEAHISNGDEYNLIFKYHVRIKILDKNGLGESDIEIPLYQGAKSAERILELKASSFNIENDRIKEEPVQDRNVFTQDVNDHWKVRKFAIPNVRVGSVIELSYTLESPFIFNFRSWEFQSDIPKMESEYWASMPGVYQYNITLRGYLKLARNESKVVKGCLGSGSGPLTGGFSADCLVMKFGMKDIPAFIEEDYMTARKNFLSSINFELSEVRHPDGRVDKVTKEWKDAELELRQDGKFGLQLRRGKDIGAQVEALVQGETDELLKAKKVYTFIRDWYVWNETYGKYSELGIKKAFDERKGNIGDINLSLIAALRFAGLDAEPVILSTRANGTVVELHPVLSEFNYVIGKVNIGDKVYLADATDRAYPFGMLPERCLNGKGRVVGDGKSYWIDLQPTEIRKTTSVLSLVLDSIGVIRGSLTSTFFGYDAVNKRREIRSFQSYDDYISDLKTVLAGIEIKDYELRNVDDWEKPLTRTLNIEVHVFDDPGVANFLFNPFLLDKFSENPFRSQERLYPVDFGVPLERITVFNLQYPAEFEIVNVPESIGLALPNSGGRFLFQASNLDHKFAMSNSLSIRKTVYTSEEYYYLKELFNHILQVQNGDLVFKRRSE